MGGARGSRSRFFVAMAALLLVIVFAGFAPTFYLKIFFDTPELPWYLHAHGAALTAWFGMLLGQTLLVATRRTSVHRRLGGLASAVSIVLVVTTIVLILNVQASRVARGVTPQQPLEFVVLGDLAALTAFSILLSVGIAFRSRPEVHKRAMLLAFIALVGPALGRIGRFPAFAEVGFVVVVAMQLLLLLAVWVHDLVRDKRVHATTAWESAAIVSISIAATTLSGTEFGKAFVAAISLGGG